jgi:hypothetical protein
MQSPVVHSRYVAWNAIIGGICRHLTSQADTEGYGWIKSALSKAKLKWDTEQAHKRDTWKHDDSGTKPGHNPEPMDLQSFDKRVDKETHKK